MSQIQFYNQIPTLEELSIKIHQLQQFKSEAAIHSLKHNKKEVNMLNYQILWTKMQYQLN